VTISEFEADTKLGQGQGHVEARATTKSRLGVGLADLSSYSNAAIKDELTYQLSQTTIRNWSTLEETHKYHDHAAFVLSHMNTFDPKRLPVFVINTSDITKSLQVELDHLKEIDPHGFDRLVREAIETLFEGINARYYHVSGLHGKVQWRFDP
jgi:hypothetical protein